MAIKTLQARLTPLGRIRLGVFAQPAGGKGRPEKLETFRFTSPSQPDIEAIAALYGGEARPWANPSTNRPEFEVITDAKLVPVYVPPQTIDPFLELWGKGFCTRRCDGEREVISDSPCVCDATGAEGRDRCKPTTRMSVILADLEGIGGWRLESHGWNAASELATMAGSIERAPAPVPADLVVDWRQEKKIVDGQVKTYQYAVPVLRFKWFTPQQAFAGALEAAGWAAVGSAERAAIEAGDPGGARTILTREDLAAVIANVSTRDDILALKEAADSVGLGEVWTARARAIHAAEQAAVPAGEREPVEAEVVADPEAVKAEADALWQQIVAAAGAKGWNTAWLTSAAGAWLTEKHGTDLWSATPDQYRAFAAAIKAGEVKP